MAPHVGRTVLRLASTAPRLATHPLHSVTAVRALSTSAQSAKKATPQVEATIPATTGKKAAAKSELIIKVKANTPTKAAATKKAPVKAAAAKSTTAAAKSTTTAAKKPAAKKPAAAKASTKATADTKLTPLQARRQRERVVNAEKREKLKAQQMLERQKKAEQAKLAREKAKEKAAKEKEKEKEKVAKEKAREKEKVAKEKEKEKEKAAKKKEKEAEMKAKRKIHAQTMRERKLERARESRRLKNEREAARKLKLKEAAKIRAEKQKIVQAKKDRLQTIKDKKAEAQIGKIPSGRPLSMLNIYVQKSAVPGGKMLNEGVISSFKNLTEAEKAALQAEMVAVNAERKEQYEKWKASQSVEELAKLNNARTWLKKNLKIKAPRIKDPRVINPTISPWTAFAAPRLKGDLGRPRSEIMREAAAAWKALSADEVQAYKQKADAMTKVRQAAMHP